MACYHKYAACFYRGEGWNNAEVIFAGAVSVGMVKYFTPDCISV